jgi:cephalosporin-C deacetylase-like acetyl esterase
MIRILTGICIFAAAGGLAQQVAAFESGPVPAGLDLRNMLTRHVVMRSCELLEETAEQRRMMIAAGSWRAWRDSVRAAASKALGPMPFAEKGGPLNVRPVSRETRPGYVIENVLFESLPGLDVNASVYLPLAEEYPPPWPVIITPVGHSAKTRENYQKPAQVFARCGYAAVTFDPPGMAGEKQRGNDHFRDGVRCYLTGHSSNRYFVVDALRCIDYCAARADMDLSGGVGMTGVSGGGLTTLYAAALDERIAVSGPACCAVPKALHPVLDQYAECPEPLPAGSFAAFDTMDLLAAAMPRRVLLMAGATDEVFTEAMSRAIAGDVAESFAAAGFADRFGFFLSPAGHAYTPAMALEFVRWMDRHVREIPDRELPAIDPDSLEMLPAEKLACHPRQEKNIFSINRTMAETQRENRGAVSMAAVRRVINAPESPGTPSFEAGAPEQVWFHALQELVLSPEPGIAVPATYLRPADAEWRGGAVIYFDDRGRWTDLRSQGMLTRFSGFLDENTRGPAVLTVDVRGWGDSGPADVRYDIAGWGSRDRWLAYVSAAMGDGVFAMRVRDGLSALAWLAARPEIDSGKIVAGGRGMGGAVALHVAALGECAGVFTLEAPASFEMLCTSENYAWPADLFLPGVLPCYDLPDLAAAMDAAVFIARPLNAAKKPLAAEAAAALYAGAADQEKGGVNTEWSAGGLNAFIRRYALP